jgi:hypothetical protein
VVLSERAKNREELLQFLIFSFALLFLILVKTNQFYKISDLTLFLLPIMSLQVSGIWAKFPPSTSTGKNLIKNRDVTQRFVHRVPILHLKNYLCVIS